MPELFSELTIIHIMVMPDHSEMSACIDNPIYVEVLRCAHAHYTNPNVRLLEAVWSEFKRCQGSNMPQLDEIYRKVTGVIIPIVNQVEDTRGRVISHLSSLPELARVARQVIEDEVDDVIDKHLGWRNMPSLDRVLDGINLNSEKLASMAKDTFDLRAEPYVGRRRLVHRLNGGLGKTYRTVTELLISVAHECAPISAEASEIYWGRRIPTSLDAVELLRAAVSGKCEYPGSLDMVKLPSVLKAGEAAVVEFFKEIGDAWRFILISGDNGYGSSEYWYNILEKAFPDTDPNHELVASVVARHLWGAYHPTEVTVVEGVLGWVAYPTKIASSLPGPRPVFVLPMDLSSMHTKYIDTDEFGSLHESIQKLNLPPTEKTGFTQIF